VKNLPLSNCALLVRTDFSDQRSWDLLRTEVWSVENNLNIANMDWADFLSCADENGIFRGF
jgi:hypothetical protein